MCVKWIPAACLLLILGACGTAPPLRHDPPIAATGAEEAIPNGVAETFAANVGDVRLAVLKSLLRMDVRVVADSQTQEGWRILAVAEDRTLLIRLESVTPTITRIRVVIDRGGWEGRPTEAALRLPAALLRAISASAA